MDSLRTYGLTHAYLDTEIKEFSNVACGLLVRALGANLRVCYLNFNSTLLSDFFMEIFNSNSFDNVNNVTFYEKNAKINLDNLNNYDLVLFDNFSFENISKDKILDFFKNKNKNLEVVFVFSNKNELEEIKEKFDLISYYQYNRNNYDLKGDTNSIFNSNNFNLRYNITGNGKGKSTYSFGYLIRNYIEKKDVALVYFDKGGDFYSERDFFNALEKFSQKNSSYGKFNFFVSGNVRFDGENFRFKNCEEDIVEAKRGLELIRDNLVEKDLIVLEELNSTISLKLLNLDEVMYILNFLKSEVMITGRYSPKNLVSISNCLIEVIDIKHYSSKGHLVRKGIDF